MSEKMAIIDKNDLLENVLQFVTFKTVKIYS